MEQLDTIFQYISNNWKIIYNSNFQKGCIAGAVLLIILIIIIKIIIKMLRGSERKCNGVIGRDENGEVFISSVAISDLIKSLEPNFSGVFIVRSMLFREKNSYIIKLIAELTDKEISFPHLVETIREQILTAARNNLGIDSIAKIDINLKRVKK